MSGFAFFYGALMGFTMAGLSACAFEYVTDKRLALDIPPQSGILESLAGVLIRLIAGPYLIARFLAELVRAGRHPLLAGAGSVLVVLWSAASGIVFVASFMP